MERTPKGAAHKDMSKSNVHSLKLRRYFFLTFKYVSNARTNIPTYTNSISVMLISNDMPPPFEASQKYEKVHWHHFLSETGLGL